ncbi:MAG TPA: hypothetical protein VN845_07670 [Solirubrobacteraceae bacterium]|nr:hypothetical protein [Solirubrobacteraceae bacterium]
MSVALLATLALAGCGGGSSTGTTQTITSTTASTVGAPTGSTSASKTTSTARPESSPAKATKAKAPGSTAPSSSAAAPPLASGPVLRRFAGSGNTSLGTIKLGSPEVLVWGAQHPPIQIFTAKGFILVSSSTPSGHIRLSRGTYAGVRVATRAAWSIELHARS